MSTLVKGSVRVASGSGLRMYRALIPEDRNTHHGETILVLAEIASPAKWWKVFVGGKIYSCHEGAIKNYSNTL